MNHDDVKNVEIEEYFDDPNYLYHLEAFDLPVGCPYRQMVPFPGSQGPGFGPPGSGFGPSGPGFGPPGPSFGPQGPATGPQGPSTPPPNFTPTKSSAGPGASTKFVDSGTIRPCVYRFVYIWPTRGRSFWAWLVYVGRRSVSGFRWNGNRWVYFGMDLRGIESFQCF